MKKRKRQLSPEEELLKGYKKKLMGEAFLKSFMVGLVSGFVLSIPVSVIAFITVYNTLWIALMIFGLATIGFTILSYFKYYRTNIKQMALRIDGVGLEERVVTMIECAGREDALAQRQRADAKQALTNVNPKQVKIPFPKLPFIILVVSALIGISLMVISTVHVSVAKESQSPDGGDNPAIAEPVETEEDKIIREMIEELRKEINEAKVKDEIKHTLHGIVDDLEAWLQRHPEATTDVKIAKISETAQKIHKILQDELSKTTIAQELQKHSTTKELGKAIATGNVDKIQAVFDKMYASIEPLRAQEKYDVLQQTGKDILNSLEDATIEPEEDALAKALEDLAKAFLELPPPPEGDGDEDKVSDEIDQAVKDAMDAAMDAIKDALEEQDQIQETDQTLQDTIKDAMEQLGYQDSSDPDDDDNKQDEDPEDPDDSDDEKDKDKEDESGTPDDGGELTFWTVIDGETPYTEVYDQYYQWAMDMLTSGNLTDSERAIIENYFNILNYDNGEK